MLVFSTLFYSKGKNYYGYGFAFPTHIASNKTTICELTKCLIHHHGIPYIIALTKELT